MSGIFSTDLLNGLYKTKELSDVVFYFFEENAATTEGMGEETRQASKKEKAAAKKVEAHKLVLYSQSKIFKKLFTHEECLTCSPPSRISSPQKKKQASNRAWLSGKAAEQGCFLRKIKTRIKRRKQASSATNPQGATGSSSPTTHNGIHASATTTTNDCSASSKHNSTTLSPSARVNDHTASSSPNGSNHPRTKRQCHCQGGCSLEYEVVGWDYDSFLDFISWFYGRPAELTREKSKALMDLSEVFAVKPLLQICKSYRKEVVLRALELCCQKMRKNFWETGNEQHVLFAGELVKTPKSTPLPYQRPILKGTSTDLHAEDNSIDNDNSYDECLTKNEFKTETEDSNGKDDNSANDSEISKENSSDEDTYATKENDEVVGETNTETSKDDDTKAESEEKSSDNNDSDNNQKKLSRNSIVKNQRADNRRRSLRRVRKKPVRYCSSDIQLYKGTWEKRYLHLRRNNGGSDIHPFSFPESSLRDDPFADSVISFTVSRISVPVFDTSIYDNYRTSTSGGLQESSETNDRLSRREKRVTRSTTKRKIQELSGFNDYHKRDGNETVGPGQVRPDTHKRYSRNRSRRDRRRNRSSTVSTPRSHPDKEIIAESDILNMRYHEILNNRGGMRVTRSARMKMNSSNYFEDSLPSSNEEENDDSIGEGADDENEEMEEEDPVEKERLCDGEAPPFSLLPPEKEEVDFVFFRGSSLRKNYHKNRLGSHDDNFSPSDENKRTASGKRKANRQKVSTPKRMRVSSADGFGSFSVVEKSSKSANKASKSPVRSARHLEESCISENLIKLQKHLLLNEHLQRQHTKQDGDTQQQQKRQDQKQQSTTGERQETETTTTKGEGKKKQGSKNNIRRKFISVSESDLRERVPSQSSTTFYLSSPSSPPSKQRKIVFMEPYPPAQHSSKFPSSSSPSHDTSFDPTQYRVSYVDDYNTAKLSTLSKEKGKPHNKKGKNKRDKKDKRKQRRVSEEKVVTVSSESEASGEEDGVEEADRRQTRKPEKADNCHHCKTKKRLWVGCPHFRAHRFCSRCITRHFSLDYNWAYDHVAVLWAQGCPVCKGLCPCASCKRRKSKYGQDRNPVNSHSSPRSSSSPSPTPPSSYSYPSSGPYLPSYSDNFHNNSPASNRYPSTSSSSSRLHTFPPSPKLSHPIELIAEGKQKIHSPQAVHTHGTTIRSRLRSSLPTATGMGRQLPAPSPLRTSLPAPSPLRSSLPPPPAFPLPSPLSVSPLNPSPTTKPTLTAPLPVASSTSPVLPFPSHAYPRDVFNGSSLPINLPPLVSWYSSNSSFFPFGFPQTRAPPQ